MEPKVLLAYFEYLALADQARKSKDYERIYVPGVRPHPWSTRRFVSFACAFADALVGPLYRRLARTGRPKLSVVVNTFWSPV